MWDGSPVIRHIWERKHFWFTFWDLCDIGNWGWNSIQNYSNMLEQRCNHSKISWNWTPFGKRTEWQKSFRLLRATSHHFTVHKWAYAGLQPCFLKLELLVRILAQLNCAGGKHSPREIIRHDQVIFKWGSFSNRNYRAFKKSITPRKTKTEVSPQTI